MTKSARCLLITFLISSAAHAGIKFPAGVFRMSQIEQAMEEARKQKKPLFFVYSDDTERISRNNTELLEDTLKAGADWSVTVYIALQDETLMPPTIYSSITGGYLPMVFIASPATDKVFKVITPPTNPIEPKDLRKHIRAELNASKAEIAAWFTAKPAHGPELPGGRKMRWLNLTNTSLREGVFDRVSNGRLYFRDEPDTPNSGIPLAELNPATRRYLDYITGTARPPKAGETAAPALKKWTNTQGKPLEASFVSLKNGTVTLRTAAGKDYVLAMETLSPESQEQARQLDADSAKEDSNGIKPSGVR